MVAVINNAHAPQIERGSASSEEIHGSSVEISDGSADESEYGSSVSIDDGSSVQSDPLTPAMVDLLPQLPPHTQVRKNVESEKMLSRKKC